VSEFNYFGIQLSDGDATRRLQDSLKQVKAVMMPVEGVLCGGYMTVNGSGEETCSCFHRDAFAIEEAQRNGLHVGVVSQRESDACRRLMERIGVRHVYTGAASRLDAYEAFRNACGLEDADCLYIGDDVVDVPVLERTGFSSTPIDGIEYLRNRVTYVSAYEGGKGCVREMIELVLQEQGKWNFCGENLCGGA